MVSQELLRHLENKSSLQSKSTLQSAASVLRFLWKELRAFI